VLAVVVMEALNLVKKKSYSDSKNPTEESLEYFLEITIQL
jgi:hypothetical protein